MNSAAGTELEKSNWKVFSSGAFLRLLPFSLAGPFIDATFQTFRVAYSHDDIRELRRPGSLHAVSVRRF